MATNRLPVDAYLSHAGERLSLGTASVKADEDSFCWSFSATLLERADYLLVRPGRGVYPEVELTVRGKTFAFIVEGSDKSVARDGSRFSISGRSPTCLLADPHSPKASPTFAETTARAIAQAICDARGLGLDWQTVDWPMPKDGWAVDAKSPLEILQQLAAAVGAVVQTPPDGGSLTVRPRHPASPTKYRDAGVAATLSDLDHFQRFSERFEAMPGYNRIRVGSPDPDPATQDPEEPAADGAKPVYKIAEDKREEGVFLKVWKIPHQPAPVLLDSAEGHVSAIYQGTFVEDLAEDVEIVDGKGSVSEHCHALLSASFYYADLGALAISAAGGVASETAGNSVAKVAYTTRYHLYRLAGGAELAQFYIEDAPP